MTTADPLLNAAGLYKSYGPTPALDRADLSVHPGEVVAVMGPSGSGKSTLLHCLAGIVRPDSGTVHYRGRELSAMSDAERSALRRSEFGFVFQFGQLVPELTCAENVALPLRLTGVARREAEARATQVRAEISVKADPAVPDAREHIHNAVETGSPETRVTHLTEVEQSDRFLAIQRALYAGAAAVMLLIGASMVVSTLEQLRERRKLLSVLVAFGTRRSTLAWSVLWQTALPVALGLVLSVLGGIGLGAVLLKLVSTPVVVHWASLGAMTGTGAGVVLLVTALSLPPLWRMMRPDGLRTE